MSEVTTEKKRVGAPVASAGTEASGNVEFVESVISIRRVTKVIKGGRRLTFAAFVVVGDQDGGVGIASGKGREVSVAITKATRKARKELVRITRSKTSIPHDVSAKFGASKVLLRSAPKGTGVIAGGAVRAIMMAAGVKDVVAKSLGSSNPISTSRAVLQAFSQLKPASLVSKLRGMSLAQIFRRS